MDSFIGWVGGKKALRDVIISKFPENVGRYVEVFGGAGWVMFRKDKVPGQMEVFNDFDSNLINLYRCIKYHPEALQKELDYILSAREIFENYREQVNIRGLTDIQRAARYFYLIKASFGCNRRSFGTRPRKIERTIARFEEITERLSDVVIENKDFESVIKLYDKQDTLFYLDPPYHKTEKYYNNEKVFDEADHRRLKERMGNIKGKFVLSYNDDEFIRELYKDYRVEGMTRSCTLSANSSGDKFKELIIRNFE